MPFPVLGRGKKSPFSGSGNFIFYTPSVIGANNNYSDSSYFYGFLVSRHYTEYMYQLI